MGKLFFKTPSETVKKLYLNLFFLHTQKKRDKSEFI